MEFNRDSTPTFAVKEVSTNLREVDVKHDGKFVHDFSFRTSEPSVLKKLMITSGPYTGLHAYVVVDASHFAFFKLPLELRRMIYKMVLQDGDRTAITTTSLKRSKQRYIWWALSISLQRLRATPPHELGQRAMLQASRNKHYAALAALKLKESAQSMIEDSPIPTKNYSIILANRALCKEAREYLYRDHHFTFAGLKTMLDWFDTIGACKKYLTHLTCEKTGHVMIYSCYRQLEMAPCLQYFKITLPISLRATLEVHIDKHYDDLKRYLLARNADEGESLRRLGHIHFAIGKEQLGVLDANGGRIKEMTPELEESCKEMIRAKLRKHFSAQIES